MIYWTMNSVPELNGLDKATKKEMFKKMYKEGRSRLGTAQIAIRTVIFIAMVVLALKFWPQMLFAGVGLIGMLVMCALIGALVAIPAILLIQTPIIDKGREWLREQGYPKTS